MGKCQLPCWKWLNFDLPESLSFLRVLCHHMSVVLSWGLNSPSACVLNFPILDGFGLCSLRAWQLLFSFELSWNQRAWFQNPSCGSQAAKTLGCMLHCHLQHCSPTPFTPLLALQQLSSKPGDRIRHRHKQFFFLPCECSFHPGHTPGFTRVTSSTKEGNRASIWGKGGRIVIL